MKEKSKLKLGQKNEMIIFSEKEKRKIIEYYFKSGLTKREVWEKYTGQVSEHGSLLKWMRQLGIKDKFKKNNKFAAKPLKMNSKIQQREEKFEILQLKNRIEELETQLSKSELKAVSFSTMIDIAEEEFNIPIRKKLNTKPSKK